MTTIYQNTLFSLATIPIILYTDIEVWMKTYQYVSIAVNAISLMYPTYVSYNTVKAWKWESIKYDESDPSSKEWSLPNHVSYIECYNSIDSTAKWLSIISNVITSIITPSSFEDESALLLFYQAAFAIALPALCFISEVIADFVGLEYESQEITNSYDYNGAREIWTIET